MNTQSEKPDHNVEIDYVGFNNDRMRITCHTCEVTVVYPIFMTRADWQEFVERFQEEHK